MKPRFPICEGRRVVKFREEEDLSPENPRVSSPPPPPSRQRWPIRRKNPRSRPDPLSYYRKNPRSMASRRNQGAKLAAEEEPSPEKPRSASPPPPPALCEPAPPVVLPELPTPESPVRFDPIQGRRLPSYFYRYCPSKDPSNRRTLPRWMVAGDLDAGSSVAAPPEAEEDTK